MIIKKTKEYTIDCADYFRWFSIYNDKMELKERVCYGGHRTKEEARLLAERYANENCICWGQPVEKKR